MDEKTSFVKTQFNLLFVWRSWFSGEIVKRVEMCWNYFISIVDIFKNVFHEINTKLNARGTLIYLRCQYSTCKCHRTVWSCWGSQIKKLRYSGKKKKQNPKLQTCSTAAEHTSDTVSICLILQTVYSLLSDKSNQWVLSQVETSTIEKKLDTTSY